MKEIKSHTVLDSFSALREGTQNNQIKASIDILQHLHKKQQENDSGECCRELQLGIFRIVRGLGSPRSCARRAYYATFIGLIKSFPSLPLQLYLEAIEKELKNDNPAEESDVYKGLVIAYGAFIESGLIFKTNNEQLNTIVSKMLSISHKRSYLKLAVYTFLVDLVKKIDIDNFKSIIWPLINRKSVNKKLSLETYHLLMVAHNIFPSIVTEEYLGKFFNGHEVLNENTFDQIAEQLLAVPCVSYIESPMYKEMFSSLLKSKKFIKKFWNLIDDRLTSPTPLRMVLAFKLFGYMSDEIKNKNLIKYSLTPNFVLLLESAQVEVNIEKARNIAITKFDKTLSKDCNLKPKTVLKIIQALYFYPGSFNFLNGSNEKIFSLLLNNATKETVQKIGKLFSDVLSDNSMKTIEKKSEENVTRAWKDNQKKSIMKAILKLLSHPSVNSCVDWKIKQLKIVIVIGFFSQHVSPKLSTRARQCLYTSLNHRFPKLTDLRSYLHGLATYFDDKLSSNNYFYIPFTGEMRTEWAKMMKTVESLNSDETDGGKLASTVFNVMFTSLGLMLLIDPKPSLENLKELQNIYKHSYTKSENIDELHWTDVIIDLILSLLSQNKKFNRQIISKIFIYLCPHLSSNNIHQILKVLDPYSNNPLVKTSEGNTSDDESDEDDSDENSDEIEDKDDSEDDSDSEDSDIDMSEDDAVYGKDYDKFRASVSDALGNCAALTDTESVDLDDMEEEEGKMLDEKLSAAFQSMKSQQQKKTQASEKKALSIFRLYMLELLEIWIKTNPELTVLLDVIVTVMMLLENTVKEGENLEFVSRLKAFIKKVTSIKSFKVTEEFDRLHLVQLVEKMTSKGDRSHLVYNSMSPEIVKCCTYLVKISMRDINDIKEVRESIVEVYKKLLNEYFLTNNSIIPVSLFQSVLEMNWEGGISLVEDVSRFVHDENSRPYHRWQALYLIETFFRNKRLLTQQFCQNNEQLVEIAKKIISDGLKQLEDNYSDQLFQHFKKTKNAIKNIGLSDVADWKSVEIDLKKMSSKKRPSSENQSAKPGKKRKLQNGNAGEANIIGAGKEGEDTVIEGHSKGKAASDQGQKKKKKKNNRLLTKKDIKLRRAKESSKGLEGSFSFSKFKDADFVHNNAI